MIKKLENTSPLPTRRGLQHISTIVERLVRMYEVQADHNNARESQLGSESSMPELVGVGSCDASATQTTFGWD